MASAYDALLEPPKSEYDVLLTPQGADNKPLFDETTRPGVVDKTMLEGIGQTALLSLGKILDFGKTAMNEIAPGFVEQATTSPIHYEMQQAQWRNKPDPNDSAAVAAAKAWNRTEAGLVDATTNPAMVATIGAGTVPSLGRVIASGFAADMASQVPSQVEQTFTAPTTQEKIEGGLGAVLSTIFATGAAVHAHGGLSEKLAPVLGEEAATPTERAIPEAVRPQEAPLETAAAPIEQAPVSEVLGQKPDETISSPAGTGGERAVAPASETLGKGDVPASSDAVPPVVEEPASPAVDEKIAPITAPTAPEIPDPRNLAQSVDENGAPATTGIAQRVHDARAAEGRQGEILPGEGVTPEEMINRGRELLKGGADPEAIIAGVSEGKAVTGDEMATLRAQHEELSKATDKAADALRKSPEDPLLKQDYEDSFKAETDFAQRIKPAATEWHKVGQSMQGETEIDTGSFTSLRREVNRLHGRDITPEEAPVLEKTAERVQQAKTEATEALQKASEEVETKVRPAKSKPRTMDELRDHFAEKIKQLTPC